MYCKIKYRYNTWNIEASGKEKKIKRIFVDFLAKIFEFALNPLTPNDPYRGRKAPLTSKVAFYIFIQQI